MSPRLASAMMNWSGYFLADIAHCLVEHYDTFGTQTFVESEIGLVGHAVGSRGIDDSLVESEHSLGIRTFDACRYFLDVGVEADTEERALFKDILDQFCPFHIWFVVIDYFVNI